MDTRQIDYLYERYLNGTLTVAERGAFDEALLDAESFVYLERLTADSWSQMDAGSQIGVPQAMSDRVYNAIVSEEKVKMVAVGAGNSFSKSWLRVIAAAVAVMTLGVWLYYGNMSPDVKSRDEVVMNDIAPGKNTATLTLASGKVISLDTNKSSVVAADSVTNATILTASTPRGGTYQVVLPDGTKVWLNAASSIKFPSSFAGLKQRRIEITGEVYFEVAKDKAHPFIASTGQQEVAVLGTHFNINAYPDEGSIKTTLLEGSVRINPLAITSSSLRGPSAPSLRDHRAKQSHDEQGVVLKPGQQASLQGEQLRVKEIDPTEAIAWKNGKFFFNRAPISAIMREVSRWYNVDITIDPEIADHTFSGSVSRFDNISTLLEQMQKTNEVNFKVTGRRIAVTQ